MHDAEARALKRAVVILLLMSSARWAWARAGPVPAPGGASEDVREELLQESRVAADEEQARSEPLGERERIDPNRADEVQLDRLPGVGAVTARAIIRARDEGAVFRRPDDLTLVRGIGPATVERLRGLLDLDRPPVRQATSNLSRAAPVPPIDVNRAGSEELQRLPGIGPALAERILTERRKRMFSSLDDLLRVPGIGPATLQRLRGSVQVSGGF